MNHTTRTSFIMTKSFLAVCIAIGLILSGFGQLHARSNSKPALSKEKQKALAENMAGSGATEVALGIALSLEGGSARSPKTRVQFATAAAKPPADPVIEKNGLKMVGAAVTGFEKQEQDRGVRKIRGMITHGDGYSRFMYTQFTALYRFVGDTSIVIDNATVKPVEPIRPRVAVFMVPAHTVPPDIGKAYPYTKVLEFVMKNAADVQGTKKTDRTLRDYYVFAFFMERLAPDAETGLLISNKPEGLSGQRKGIVRFQQDGWHGAFIPATFGIDKDPEVYFKVLFKPGSYTPIKQRLPRLLGVYTTASTVTLIQRALAERGYDPGPADGLMGRRTRQAIRKFQQDQGLKIDGTPSASLLAVLNESGQLPGGTEIKVLPVVSKKDTGAPDSTRGPLAPKIWPNKIKRP